MSGMRKTLPRLWDSTFLVNRELHRHIALAIKDVLPGTQGRMLDVGCGLQPYRSLFEGRVSDYVGCDLYPADPSIVSCPADALPFPNGAFDLVACFQVLEHVPRPWLVVAECARVLKPGGILLVTAPFIYPHHPSPSDFYRFTHEGLRALAEQAGLEVRRLEAQCGSLATLCMLTGVYASPFAARLARVPLVGLAASPARGLVAMVVNTIGLALSAVVRPFGKGLTGHSNYLMLAAKTSASRD